MFDCILLILQKTYALKFAPIIRFFFFFTKKISKIIVAISFAQIIYRGGGGEDASQLSATLERSVFY